MLISPGGAFMFRSENNEGSEVAKEFAKLGYIYIKSKLLYISIGMHFAIDFFVNIFAILLCI